MRHARLTLALLLAAVATGQTPSSPAVVALGAPTGAVVAPHGISGFNYGNSMLVVRWQERFDALNVGTIRFPPGNVADENALNQAAVDALVQNWRLLGEPEITFVVNLFTGSPEETAEAVRLLMAARLPVTLWELGNEPDLFATNRGDPSWTPAKYCEAFRLHGEAVRSVLPGARLAGPGVSGGRPSALDYLREVLTLCGDVIDVLTFHVYPTDGTWPDAPALATSDLVTTEMAMLRGWLADERINPLGAGRDVPLGVTEFGLSWRTQNFRHLEDMSATLWLADTLGRLATSGVEVSHYFALQGMGGHGLIDSSGWVRPTWHLYSLLAGFVGQVTPAAVEGSAALTAYAAVDGGVLKLLLVNRGEELWVDLRVPGGFEALSVSTMSEAQYQDLDGEAVVEGVLEPGQLLYVPALSITVLEGR